MLNSSSSNVRWSAIARLYPTAHGYASQVIESRSGVELGERARHLGLDVQRLESLPLAPFVARHHQLQHLLRDSLVVLRARRLRSRQLGDLRVDVQRRLASAYQPFAAR